MDSEVKEEIKIPHNCGSCNTTDFTWKYEEPIYSFVPSIGISRIIEINDNFSNKWQNNYFITSLRKKSLYRVEFDNKFTKVKTIEKINVGKRIRDISYSSTKKLFFLALESKQANLGILYKK